MDRLRRHYLTTLRREGIALNNVQLHRYSKDLNLGLAKTEIGELVKEWLETSRFSPYKKSKSHQTFPLSRGLGCLHIDYSQYQPQLGTKNSGCKAIIVAVDAASGRAAAIAVRNKTTDEFIRAVTFLLGKFDVVRTILSDRERALQSNRFRSWLEPRRIKIFFMRGRLKAYMAETILGRFKTQLSISLAATGSDRWIEKLAQVVLKHNKTKQRGTSFDRRDINPGNYLEFVDELVGNAEAEFATGRQSYEGFSKTQRKELFKFAPGDQVTVSKVASYTEEAYKRPKFFKASSRGQFTTRIFEVTRAELRSTSKGSLVPGQMRRRRLGRLRSCLTLWCSFQDQIP